VRGHLRIDLRQSRPVHEFDDEHIRQLASCRAGRKGSSRMRADSGILREARIEATLDPASADCTPMGDWPEGAAFLTLELAAESGYLMQSREVS
jgi:hypothetical protein